MKVKSFYEIFFIFILENLTKISYHATIVVGKTGASVRATGASPPKGSRRFALAGSSVTRSFPILERPYDKDSDTE